MADEKQRIGEDMPLTVSHMFGEVVWLMSQSSAHKHFSLGDLEWMVMPPIMHEQFRVFRSDQTPVGIALWAHLSEEAERRLNETAMAGQGARLRPDEWKSGDRVWLVELIAPQATSENNLIQSMIADLAANVFPDKTFKFHTTDPATGKREVQTVNPSITNGPVSSSVN